MALNVLVFDDDELIRSTISFFLKSEGFEVQSYPKPSECPVYLNSNCHCQKTKPCTDVIITDLNMPGETGVEFLRNQLNRGCKVNHIAVMSGDWDDPHLDMARQLGCRIFQKPFSIVELRDWLNEIKKSWQATNCMISKSAKNKRAKNTSKGIRCSVKK